MGPAIGASALLAALPYGAAICQRDGKILHCNDALAQILGVGVDDISHKKASFLSQGLAEDLDTIFSSGRTWRGDISVLGLENKAIPCSLTVSALEWPGASQTLPCVLLTLLENTNNRLAERDLLTHNQERNDVNATKTDFLANMGHELRTPLNAIIGNAELIAQGVLGDISQTYRECGHDIHDAGQHLLSLVNDVLESSKLAEGAMTITPTLHDVVPIAREAVKMLRDDYHRRHHQLTVNLPDHSVIIPCDRLKLKQILINILTNAGKFTADGGEISLSLYSHDDEAVFQISDNGVGIAPQDIPRALARFSQLHPKGIKESAGTGLGLPLAKMLTELHGGRLSIESEPRHGTTIKIHLPTIHPEK
ncbi:histidine kinase [Thalassospira mesophila]|uniref:histidine kinase n=1 Tax=Thalassospira mesophila TaxID=1293891 RepID=A0A1Y2L079_9PROT|nr:histidine kinase [Thalassospira mesophila]